MVYLSHIHYTLTHTHTRTHARTRKPVTDFKQTTAFYTRKGILNSGGIIIYLFYSSSMYLCLRLSCISCMLTDVKFDT